MFSNKIHLTVMHFSHSLFSLLLFLVFKDFSFGRNLLLALGLQQKCHGCVCNSAVHRAWLMYLSVMFWDSVVVCVVDFCIRNFSFPS